MWSKILISNPKSQTTWRNLTGLIKSLLILPLTNSQLEQFCCFIGNVKTDWRCGLKENTVEALERITIEGPMLARTTMEGQSLIEWAAFQTSSVIELWCK